jgi:type IV pilus biogenesis protein CpaD/CtpE
VAKFDRIARVAAVRRSPARVVVLTLVLALLAASCSDDDSATPSTTPEPERSSTTSATTSTTTTNDATSTSSPATDSVEDEIIARYIGYWEARFAANTGTPNPDDPALREFATGEQLETVIDETRQRRDDALSLRIAEPSRTDHTVAVVSSSTDRAELQDCFVNDGVVYRIATGEVVDDSVVTRNFLAVMVRVEGAWKLERGTVIQEWEGIAGCALGR